MVNFLCRATRIALAQFAYTACEPGVRAAEEFMLLTPELSRAARALLKWKPEQLATAAGLDLSVVERFEDDGLVVPASVEAMLEALRGAGLEFIAAGGQSLDGGPGLRTIPMPEPEVTAAEEIVEMEEPLLPSAVDPND